VQTLSSLISEPTQNERKAFASVAGEIRPGSIALAFTPEQLKLIADALLWAEVSLCERSQIRTKRAETAATPAKVANELRLADEYFCRSCDARDLSEKISAELRRARA
jgi:hypothetical protein